MISTGKAFVRWLLGGRPTRYLIAGTINTAFSFAIYPALLWAFPYFRTHYLLGLAVVQPVGITFSFTTQKIGVFRTAGGPLQVLVEYLRYVSFYLVYFVLNWAALPVLVKLAAIPPVIAQTLFQLVVIVAGYFWHGRVTFERKPVSASADKAALCD